MIDLADKVGAAIGAELVRQELAGEDLSEAESNRLLGQVALEAMGRAPNQVRVSGGQMQSPVRDNLD